MAPEKDKTNQAKKRLAKIDLETKKIRQTTEQLYKELERIAPEMVKKANQARDGCAELANLRAEALYLSLLNEIAFEEPETPENPLESLESMWRDIRVSFQPARADNAWLEKLRAAEQERNQRPVLSVEERQELESRLKDNVCPLCVNFSLDGSCTLQSFETCPITIYLNRMVEILEELGHRPWMEDYFERMYRDICPGCQGRVDKDYCPPKEEGDCSLFTYLPTVVRTIENFMQEREASRSSEGA